MNLENGFSSGHIPLKKDEEEFPFGDGQGEFPFLEEESPTLEELYKNYKRIHPGTEKTIEEYTKEREGILKEHDANPKIIQSSEGIVYDRKPSLDENQENIERYKKF